MDASGNGHKEGTALIYRTLALEEWSRAAAQLKAHGLYVPHPKMATAHVAETLDGEIAGLGIMQMILHAEPWLVNEGWHGRVDLPRIERMMAVRARVLTSATSQTIMPGYVLDAIDERQAKLAEIAGFVERPGWRVFVKEF